MNMKRLMNLLVMLVIASGYLMTTSTGCTDATGPSTPSNTDGFGVNATVVVSDEVSASEANDVRANVSTNSGDTIVFETEDLIDILHQLFPDAEVLGLHLDYDREDLNYECVVRTGGGVYLVVIDPRTGKVKDQKKVDKYYYTGTIVILTHVVKAHKAKERAREIVHGDVVEVNLEEVEGEPTYIIILLTPQNRYVTIYIDAKTGKEKKLKDEKRCNGDKDTATTGGDQDTHSGDCDRHKNERGRGHYRHGEGKGYGHYYHCHCHCDCENGGGDSLTVITRDSAKVLLGQTFGDSAVVDSLELETEDDSTAFYTTVVENGNDRYEVKMNAVTGALVQVTQTDGDMEGGEFEPPAVDGVTLVSLSEARAAALAELPGTIQSWTLERNKDEGRWVYVFTVEDAATSTVKTVRVDAETGLFIEII